MPPLIIAAKPITNVIFIKFAPKTLPKEKEGTFSTAEEIPIKSSGTEVAKLIKIKAIANSESLKNCASLIRDFTSMTPDLERKMKDIKNIIIYKIMFYFSKIRNT